MLGHKRYVFPTETVRFRLAVVPDIHKVREAQSITSLDLELEVAATRPTRQHDDSLLQIAEMRYSEMEPPDGVKPQVLVCALRACDAYDAPPPGWDGCVVVPASPFFTKTGNSTDVFSSHWCRT